MENEDSRKTRGRKGTAWTVAFVGVVAVLVGAVAIRTSHDKKEMTDPGRIQARLERITEEYMRRNVTSAEGYVPGETSLTQENWVEAEKTLEIENAEAEYAALYGSLSRMVEDRSVPLEEVEAGMRRLDSLDGAVRAMREANRVQDGWIIRHDYTNDGKKAVIWLITDNDRTCVKGIAMKYIQDIVEKAMNGQTGN